MRVITFVTNKGALIFLTVLRLGLSSVDSSYVRDKSDHNHEASQAWIYEDILMIGFPM